MKCPRSSLVFTFLVLTHIKHALAAPQPVRARGAISLVEFSKAPSPTPSIVCGDAGDFVSIDSATKLFKFEGKPQRFVGTNSWWLSATKDSSEVDKVLSNLAKSGILATRVWGFGETDDPSQSVQSTFFQQWKEGKQLVNMDPATGIPKLDYVISQAEKEKVKLIIPLLNGNDAKANEPKPPGSIGVYMAKYGLHSKKDFYTTIPKSGKEPNAQDAYYAYVDFIVSRYKDSPAVFAWEICNEPQIDCDTDCDTSIITKWATDVSKHIKSQDPKHLVSLGDEGWFAPTHEVPDKANSYPYRGTKGIDFEKNLAIPDIDFGTFHMYPEQWGESSDWGNTYIEEHAKIGIAQGRPVVLEEYGVLDANKDDSKAKARIATMQQWQDTIVKEKLAGDFVWQLAGVSPDTISKSADGYEISYDEAQGSLWDEVVAKHVKAVKDQAGGGS